MFNLFEDDLLLIFFVDMVFVGSVVHLITPTDNGAMVMKMTSIKFILVAYKIYDEIKPVGRCTVPESISSHHFIKFDSYLQYFQYYSL